MSSNSGDEGDLDLYGEAATAYPLAAMPALSFTMY